MKKQVIRSIVSAAVFATSPVIAMENDDLETMTNPAHPGYMRRAQTDPSHPGYALEARTNPAHPGYMTAAMTDPSHPGYNSFK